jgi:hypothetical protein
LIKGIYFQISFIVSPFKNFVMATSASKLATLELGGEKYKILQTTFESMKSVDDQNRATFFVKQATGRFMLEGTGKAAKVFEKFSNSRNRNDATLTLSNTHEDGDLARMTFKESSITYYVSDYAKEINYGSGKLEFNQNT